MMPKATTEIFRRISRQCDRRAIGLIQVGLRILSQRWCFTVPGTIGHDGFACKFWRDCGIIGGGCCAKGHYGGKPSLGTCRVCPHYSGRPRGLGDVVHTIAEPIAAILKALQPRNPKSPKHAGIGNCRCAQRRREWNNRRIH